MHTFKILIIALFLYLFLYEGWEISNTEFNKQFDSYDKVLLGVGELDDFVNSGLLLGHVSVTVDILSNPFETRLCIPLWQWSPSNIPYIRKYTTTHKISFFQKPHDIIVNALIQKYPCNNP